MNERLITLAGVLISLAVIVSLFVQTPIESPVTRPTSAETGPNGYRALYQWLESSDIRVLSHRERLDELKLLTMAETGNLLITTLPWEREMRPDERSALLAWVEAGNSLLIMAALNDTPDWSIYSNTESFTEDLEILTGTVFEAAIDEDDQPLNLGIFDMESALNLNSLGISHPLVEGVTTIAARSDFPASIWIPAEGSTAPGYAFLREETSGIDSAWTNARGAGHVVLIANGSTFSNRVLGESHNRYLFANLLRWHLSPGGTVIFDDLHQGLSRLYDPEAFFSDSRVGVTVCFVLAFWFLYMVGTQNRMLPLHPTGSVPRQEHFVRAMGGFLARKLTPVATAQLMLDEWLTEVADRMDGSAAPSTWAQLEASPLINRSDLTELQNIHTQVEAGRETDLERLHNCIHRLREALG